MSSYLSLLAIAGLSVGGVLGAGLLQLRARRLPGWLRAAVLYVALVVAGLASVFLPAEAWFRCCLAESDGINRTLATRLWMDRYWKPINSLGYRDEEHPPSSLLGKRVVFVVGDSFVAGHGIEDIRDRMSAVLQERLGNDWVVITIARNAWATEDEAAAVESYPARPDVIVLGYNTNDIEGAATRLGRPRPLTNLPPPDGLGLLFDHSYLANFTYWRVFRWTRPELASEYRAWAAAQFADEQVWRAHTQALQRIVDDARASRAVLVAALFPDLADARDDEPQTAKVGAYLAEQGVASLDFARILADRDPRELVVSTVNPHPNARLHREFGERVADWIGSHVT